MLRNMKAVARNFQILRGEYIDTSNPRRGLITEIADEYCGGLNAANSTSRQLAGVPIRLSSEVIECIGSIMNTEHPVLALRLLESNKSRGKRSRVDPSLMDTRVFRNLFNTSTFRSAGVFKEASVDADRINGLLRCQYLAINKGIKSVNGTKLNEQVRNAIPARKEVNKINIVIGSERWPPELETVRSNLLRTTKLDEQVRGNTGEDLTILPRLQELFEAHHGSRASQRIALFQQKKLLTTNGGNSDDAGQNNDTSSLEENFNHEKDTSAMESDFARGGSRENLSGKVGNKSSHPHREDINFGINSKEIGASLDELLERADDIEGVSNLDKLGISMYQMTWETYQDTIIQSQEQLQVDRILTDPLYCLPTSRTPTGEGYNDQIDEREMDMFP